MAIGHWALGIGQEQVSQFAGIAVGLKLTEILAAQDQLAQSGPVIGHEGGTGGAGRARIRSLPFREQQAQQTGMALHKGGMSQQQVGQGLSRRLSAGVDGGQGRAQFARGSADGGGPDGIAVGEMAEQGGMAHPHPFGDGGLTDLIGGLVAGGLQTRLHRMEPTFVCRDGRSPDHGSAGSVASD